MSEPGRRLDLAELEALYSAPSFEGRDELLEALLVAASKSGESVIQRLEECLLEVAGRELTEGPSEGRRGAGE